MKYEKNPKPCSCDFRNPDKSLRNVRCEAPCLESERLSAGRNFKEGKPDRRLAVSGGQRVGTFAGTAMFASFAKVDFAKMHWRRLQAGCAHIHYPIMTGWFFRNSISALYKALCHTSTLANRAEGFGDVPRYKRSGSDALLRAHGGAGMFAKQIMREQGAEGFGDVPRYKRREVGKIFADLSLRSGSGA